MYVFRIHIRPQGGSVDNKTAFDYCLKNDILGVGWRTDSNRNTTSWEDYFDEASQIHKDFQGPKYIKKWVSKNDLVWTRDADANYYLAQVVSGWEYWVSEEAIEKDIDIANIFRVDLKKIDIDEVPGKIVACFRAPRTIQEVADKKAIAYTKYLWNTLINEDVYPINKSEFSDIFMMLDDEETEDLVFLYLQSRGWYVLPNSRKGDTMKYEYLVVNPKSGEISNTQIKTGETRLNIDEYISSSKKTFLFQSNELYTGTLTENVICIRRSELLKFFNESFNWLPKSFKRKGELIS